MFSNFCSSAVCFLYDESVYCPNKAPSVCPSVCLSCLSHSGGCEQAPGGGISVKSIQITNIPEVNNLKIHLHTTNLNWQICSSSILLHGIVGTGSEYDTFWPWRDVKYEHFPRIVHWIKWSDAPLTEKPEPLRRSSEWPQIHLTNFNILPCQKARRASATGRRHFLLH